MTYGKKFRQDALLDNRRNNFIVIAPERRRKTHTNPRQLKFEVISPLTLETTTYERIGHSKIIRNIHMTE
jgi:hypothetical protein